MCRHCGSFTFRLAFDKQARLIIIKVLFQLNLTLTADPTETFVVKIVELDHMRVAFSDDTKGSSETPASAGGQWTKKNPALAESEFS